MRPAARRAKRALAAKSQTTINRRASLSSITSSDTSDSSSDGEDDADTQPDDEEGLPKRGAGRVKTSNDECMSVAELEVLKRLATRCNVLPIVARTDTLTNERIAMIRNVVRRDLMEAGLGFGVFDPSPPPEQASPSPKSPKSPFGRRVQISTPRTPTVASPSVDTEEDEETDEERESRPVIKLLPLRIRDIPCRSPRK